MEDVEAYSLRRQNMAVQYIATQLILDLCEEAVQWPGTRVSKKVVGTGRVGLGWGMCVGIVSGSGSAGGGTILFCHKGGRGVLGN